jgi:MFS family permease
MNQIEKRPGGNPVARITGAVFLLVMGFALCNNIIQNTMGPIIKNFSLLGARQGLMSSMISLGSVIALILAPLLQGRVRKLTMLSIAALLQALMLGLSGYSPTFGVLLAACVLLGLGGGWTDNYANSLIVDLHGKNSPRYLGMLHGFFGIGGLLTPLVIGAVLTAYPWRTAYIIAAMIFGIISGIFSAIALKSRRKLITQSGPLEKRFTAGMLMGYLRSRRNLLLIAAGIMYSASQQGFAGWLIRYMDVRFHAEILGSAALSLFWIASTLSRFLAPLIKARPLAVFSVGTLLSAGALIGGVLLGGAAAMCVAAALIGLVSGHSMPMLLGEAASGYRGNTSLPTSVMLLCMTISRMAMPLLMGGVSAWSIAAVLCLPAAAAACAGVFGALSMRAARTV